MKADKDYLVAMVDWFNRTFPVGTKILVRRDNNDVVITEVVGSAILFYNEDAVAWFKDIAGFYSIDDHPDGGWRVQVAERTEL